MPERTRRLARRRSLTVLTTFTLALVVAFRAPRVAFGLIFGALLFHVRPEGPGGLQVDDRLAPGARVRRAASE
jgi:hypothetical protein